MLNAFNMCVHLPEHVSVVGGCVLEVCACHGVPVTILGVSWDVCLWLPRWYGDSGENVSLAYLCAPMVVAVCVYMFSMSI